MYICLLTIRLAKVEHSFKASLIQCKHCCGVRILVGKTTHVVEKDITNLSNNVHLSK